MSQSPPAPPMRFSSALARRLLRLHRTVRSSYFVGRFVVLVRWMMAAAFLPSGWKKVSGERFTTMSVDTTIGSFFEAFFQAHEFYILVGAVQLVAAILLLFPRTALLGALLFLPVITNIVVITWSLQFRGTWLVTAALLSANLLVLLWDLHRLLPLIMQNEIVARAVFPAPSPSNRLGAVPAASMVLGFGLAGLGLGLLLSAGPSPLLGVWALVIGALCFPLFLASLWELVATLNEAGWTGGRSSA